MLVNEPIFPLKRRDTLLLSSHGDIVVWDKNHIHYLEIEMTWFRQPYGRGCSWCIFRKTHVNLLEIILFFFWSLHSVHLVPKGLLRSWSLNNWDLDQNKPGKMSVLLPPTLKNLWTEEWWQNSCFTFLATVATWLLMWPGYPNAWPGV